MGQCDCTARKHRLSRSDYRCHVHITARIAEMRCQPANPSNTRIVRHVHCQHMQGSSYHVPTAFAYFAASGMMLVRASVSVMVGWPVAASPLLTASRKCVTASCCQGPGVGSRFSYFLQRSQQRKRRTVAVTHLNSIRSRCTLVIQNCSTELLRQSPPTLQIAS